MPRPARSNPLPATARDAAVLALLNAWGGDSFVEDSLRSLRDAERLTGREAGLAAEIALGAMRRAGLINTLLARLASVHLHTTPKPVLAILHAGIFQLVWLDRVPEFAAVDEAVEQARRMAGGRAPKLVNAVLRNVGRSLSDRRTAWRRLDPSQIRTGWDTACSFSGPVLPEPGDEPATLAHLAAATGMRPARFAQLAERFGLEAAEAIGWAEQAVPPTVLQRNGLRCTPERFTAGLRERYGDAVELAGEAAFLSPSESPIDSPIFADGGAWVQDNTARRAAELLAAMPGQRVLDLCAAPGGKSIALAVAMQDRGEIVACDASARRLRSLAQNLARLDLYCVRAHELPPLPSARRTKRPDRRARRAAPQSAATPAADDPLRQPFDAALLDVPCSNSGVVARRPEARRNLTPARLRSLIDLQRGLLLRGAARVRPGGRLVYSTCSIEPEENQQQIAWLMSAQSKHWTVEREEKTLPAWGPRLSDWRDGGYAAVLRHNE